MGALFHRCQHRRGHHRRRGRSSAPASGRWALRWPCRCSSSGAGPSLPARPPTTRSSATTARRTTSSCPMALPRGGRADRPVSCRDRRPTRSGQPHQRFADTASITANASVAHDLLAEVFAQHTVEEWREKLQPFSRASGPSSRTRWTPLLTVSRWPTATCRAASRPTASTFCSPPPPCSSARSRPSRRGHRSSTSTGDADDSLQHRASTPTRIIDLKVKGVVADPTVQRPNFRPGQRSFPTRPFVAVARASRAPGRRRGEPRTDRPVCRGRRRPAAVPATASANQPTETPTPIRLPRLPPMILATSSCEGSSAGGRPRCWLGQALGVRPVRPEQDVVDAQQLDQRSMSSSWNGFTQTCA